MGKGKLITYWIATSLLSFGMLASGAQQVIKTKEMTELLAHLGYPAYFMVIIGVWKILAVVAILMPGFKILKEWAYAGLFFTMTGAFVSHIACGNPSVKDILGPVFQTVFIMLSWYFRPANRKVEMT